MRLGSRILAFALVAALAFWFTAENSRELVNVDLFLFRIRASLPLIVFGSMLVGMLAVFLVGLRADLRTRQLLSRYRAVIEGEDPALSRTTDDRTDTYAGVGEAENPSQEEGRSDDRARLDAWT